MAQKDRLLKLSTELQGLVTELYGSSGKKGTLNRNMYLPYFVVRGRGNYLRANFNPAVANGIPIAIN